jgi:type IV secretion system T-DNA border endonuclease VirD1
MYDVFYNRLRAWISQKVLYSCRTSDNTPTASFFFALFICTHQGFATHYYTLMALLATRPRSVGLCTMQNSRSSQSAKYRSEHERNSQHGVVRNGAGDEYRIVSVRLRRAEFDCFAESAAAAGLSANMAFRIVARRIAGFLETDVETKLLLQSIAGSVADISSAINVLGRAAEESSTVDMARFTQLRTEFGREFARLDDLLRTVLNVSRRRQDGHAMLRAAAQASGFVDGRCAVGKPWLTCER